MAVIFIIGIISIITIPTLGSLACWYEYSKLYLKFGADTGGSGVDHICATYNQVNRCTALGSGSTTISFATSTPPGIITLTSRIVHDKAGNEVSGSSISCAVNFPY